VVARSPVDSLTCRSYRFLGLAQLLGGALAPTLRCAELSVRAVKLAPRIGLGTADGVAFGTARGGALGVAGTGAGGACS
jgi:uncharacterized membrane protein YdjX (TVP38/TMEM64 family)